MRTIRETIAGGISTLAELQEALQTAIQLEFSTIPPYLCAEWSIDTDPSNVGPMVHGVVIQEMLHFGLACNMLTATGGAPSIANAGFVRSYPGALPGGVHPGLIVDLLPMGIPALNTFMQIEFPEGGSIIPQPPPPLPPNPPTIGAFYDTIASGFNTVYPDGKLPNGGKNQVVTDVDGDSLFAINVVADALAAIKTIKDQGEGTSTSPDEDAPDGTTTAHYYTFSEVFFGKAIVSANGVFSYGGAAIQMPSVYPFSPKPGADQKAFVKAFSNVLIALEACWTSGASIDSAIRQMFPLQTAGTALIQTSAATPSFVFQAS